MADLLNCPFCGETKAYIDDYQPSKSTDYTYSARCPGCALSSKYFVTPDKAADFWNNQTEVLRLQAEIARLREELERNR